MPQPCTICSRMDRAAIDMRLAMQVVNVSQLARELGVGHQALRRHRAEHLPDFLPAFAADAAPRDPGTIRAEAERLYLTTLDALARAQAGVLAHVDDDGVAVKRVSMSTVARLIRESRQGLDLLAKLSVASGGDDTAPHGVNAELDDRIAKALERVATRSLDAAAIDVEDAEVVPEPTPPEAARPEAGPTPGPSAAAAPARARDRQESQAAQDQSQHDGLSRGAASVTEHNHPGDGPSNLVHDYAEATPDVPEPHYSRPWDGNPAASYEERRAAGYEPPPTARTVPHPATQE